MNTKMTAVLGLALLLSAAPTWASLDTVTLDYEGFGAAGSAKIYGGGNDGLTIPVGAFKYEVVGTTDTDSFTVGSTIGLFCIELEQYIPTGTATYNVQNAASSVGTGKADLLSELWGRYYDSSWITSSSYTTQQKDAAEAFQLCVWEIVYEDYGNNLNVKCDSTYGYGGFKAKDTNYDLANMMLSSLNGTGTKATLVALTNNCKQDFITATNCEVPEPSTIVLLGLGMAVVSRSRRKRI